MTKDAIFRIYSMTKPITTVAAMMLFEEGKLALERSRRQIHPGLQGRQSRRGEEGCRRQGRRWSWSRPSGPMTVQDLMRHSSGLTYGFFGDRRGQEGLSRRQPRRRRSQTTPSSSTAWPSCRWSISPGTTWDYSQSTDVLGRVVEVVTGKPLSQALKEMLLDPLGMTDTSFYVTEPAKQPRIAEPFANDRTIGAGASRQRPARCHASTSPAAAAWSARRRTTRASCRCSPTAARSTASAI